MSINFKMKKILLVLILFIPGFRMTANVAQPGIWNAGGMGNFSLLFPEDSLAFKKIQMVDEKVSIQLYKGYAVVKGIYKMYNSTGDTVKLKTGYPLNSNFRSETNNTHRAEIMFDSLYGLDVKINSVPAKIISEPYVSGKVNSENENWYVWNNIFAPEDTTVITVYFIVNTNNTMIRKGYTKDKFNGFMYLLETGSTWKQPIIKGEIRIKTEDNISIDDIKGLSPDSIFKTDADKNLLQYKFTNVSPENSDNIIITYSENIEDLNFDNILSLKTKLYNSIDEFSEMDINPEGLKHKKFQSPYEVESSDWVSILLVLSVIGIPVIIVLVLITLFILLLIWIIKRKKKKNLN